MPGDGIGPEAMEQACIDALAAGARTPDLGGTLNTSQVGDAVPVHLERLAAVSAV